MPTHRSPVVVSTLVAVCTLAFLFEMSLPPAAASRLLSELGLIPARVSLSPEGLYPFVTSMFLHGGWFHLIGNMLFLWIFGNNVEDRMGHGRFLVFYLLCGVGAAALHAFLYPDSAVPTIGASGAIAGVLGAYLVLYPGARIVALVPLGFILTTMEVPALLFLVLWFVMQFFSGVGDLVAQASQVAYWAHVGGFVAGLLLVKLFDQGRGPQEERRGPYVQRWGA